MYGFSESEAKKSPASYGYKTLFRLEIDGFIPNSVFIVREKIVHPVGDVGEGVSVGRSRVFSEPVDGERKYHKYRKRSQKMLEIPSSDEKHGDDERSTDEYGSEIGLEYQEEHDNPEIEHIWKESIEKIPDLRATFFEKVGKIDDEPKLHEFHGLEREGEKGDIDPSSGPIVGRPYEKHQRQRGDSRDEDMFRIPLKKRIGGLYDECKKQKAQEHMSNVFQKVEIVVRLGKQSFRHHERRHLKRGVDADRAYHDHAEYHERQHDEKYGVVDVFGLHRRSGFWLLSG